MSTMYGVALYTLATHDGSVNGASVIEYQVFEDMPAMMTPDLRR
jgi:hypothetical protein